MDKRTKYGTMYVYGKDNIKEVDYDNIPNKSPLSDEVEETQDCLIVTQPK